MYSYEGKRIIFFVIYVYMHVCKFIRVASTYGFTVRTVAMNLQARTANIDGGVVRVGAYNCASCV